MARRPTYELVATKGMAQCMGVCAFKYNGKIIRYFATWAEGHEFAQAYVHAGQ